MLPNEEVITLSKVRAYLEPSGAEAAGVELTLASGLSFLVLLFFKIT